jgi:hypothetical protein
VILIASSASLCGLALGRRWGYNERLRHEVEDTVEEMLRRTDEYRAAHIMSPLTPTFAYGTAIARRQVLKQ